MKIYASKRDEILKRKAAYEEEVGQRRSRYNEQHGRFRKAQYDITEQIRKAVQDELKGVNLNLSIEADVAPFSGLKVTVKDEKLHDAAKALSWSWEVSLDADTGEVKKDSSSWSGLNATSDENIRDLEEILKAVKILNRIDWADVLNKDMPEYDDYITEKNPDWDRDKPNFDKELQEAEIEEAIGQPVGIKGHGNQFYRSRTVCYYKILKESPTQYTVQEIFQDYVNDPGRWPGSYRIRKDNFMGLIDKPIETINLPE